MALQLSDSETVKDDNWYQLKTSIALLEFISSINFLIFYESGLIIFHTILVFFNFLLLGSWNLKMWSENLCNTGAMFYFWKKVLANAALCWSMIGLQYLLDYLIVRDTIYCLFRFLLLYCIVQILDVEVFDTHWPVCCCVPRPGSVQYMWVAIHFRQYGNMS